MWKHISFANEAHFRHSHSKLDLTAVLTWINMLIHLLPSRRLLYGQYVLPYMVSRAYQEMKMISDVNRRQPKDEVWSVDHCAEIVEKSDNSLRWTKPLEINRSKIRRKSQFLPLFLPVMIVIAMISA